MHKLTNKMQYVNNFRTIRYKNDYNILDLFNNGNIRFI